MKRLAIISNGIGTGLITTAVISASLSIPALTREWASPVGVASSSITILLPLATAASRRSSQLFTVKQEKHNSIKLLPKRKLNSISDAISKPILDENISPAEFHKILQMMKKYRKLKEKILRRNKAKVQKITKNKRKSFLSKEKKKRRKNFYEKSQALQVSRVSVQFKA